MRMARLAVQCAAFWSIAVMAAGCGGDETAQGVDVPDVFGLFDASVDVVPDTAAPIVGCAGQVDGTPCDDDSACTTGTVCGNGVCAGGESVVCPDSGQCTSYACDPKDGCVATVKDDGAACTLACYTSAACQSGACTGVAKLPCPKPTGPCDAALECDSESGLCSVVVRLPEGTPCDVDQNVCTFEACYAA